MAAWSKKVFRSRDSFSATAALAFRYGSLKKSLFSATAATASTTASATVLLFEGRHGFRQCRHGRHGFRHCRGGMATLPIPHTAIPHTRYPLPTGPCSQTCTGPAGNVCTGMDESEILAAAAGLEGRVSDSGISEA